MKTLLWTTVFLVIFNYTNAQLDSFARNDIYAGYGLLSDMRIIFESENFIGIIAGAQYADVSGTGAFIFGYNHYLSQKISIGGEINYQYLQMTGEYASGEPIHNHYSFVNLIARFDYHYLNHEMCQLYSGVSLGPAFIIGQWQNDEGVEKHFAPFISYQINLIGIRVGKKWAGFGELGFGRNGVLTLGVSGKF